MSEYITLKEGDELRPTDEIRNVGRLIDWREAIWGGRILFIDIHEGWEFRRPVEPQEALTELRNCDAAGASIDFDLVHRIEAALTHGEPRTSDGPMDLSGVEVVELLPQAEPEGAAEWEYWMGGDETRPIQEGDEWTDPSFPTDPWVRADWPRGSSPFGATGFRYRRRRPIAAKAEEVPQPPPGRVWVEPGDALQLGDENGRGGTILSPLGIETLGPCKDDHWWHRAAGKEQSPQPSAQRAAGHENCEVCRGTGYYGDNGPGINGSNREYVECDAPQPPPSAGKEAA